MTFSKNSGTDFALELKLEIQKIMISPRENAYFHKILYYRIRCCKVWLKGEKVMTWGSERDFWCLGCSWALLGFSWALLGALLGALGALLDVFGTLGAFLGRSWGALGVLLGRSGGALRRWNGLFERRSRSKWLQKRFEE